MISDRKTICLILLANSYFWANSSFGKLTGGKFVDSLAGVLTKFANNNPYPWYKSFLLNLAIPNAKLFGNLTMWGEAAVALGSIVSLLYLLSKGQPTRLVKLVLLLSLLGGIFLNAIFWLAAGWTSASTDSLNLLMLLIQTLGFVWALGLKA